MTTVTRRRCTPITHTWAPGPGVDPTSGLRNVCSHCGVGRFEEARVYELEQHLEKVKDFLGSSVVVIDSFRPLVNASRALLDFTAQPHRCPGVDCALCAPRDELVRAFEGIADMVADADAEAGVAPAVPA
jgi:hypothetical protein